MQLDEAGLDEYTDRFDRDAFRHETRTHYQTSGGSDEHTRWLAGEMSPGSDADRPWSAWVRAQLDRGAAVRRLRVVYGPLSDHLRFELGWQYPANAAAGEEIRVLDLTERPRPVGMVDDEFWMLDGERAVLMTYADDGRFLHGDAVEGRDADRIRRARDAAWDAAEPFDQWWTRHPEYHRAVTC